MCRAALIRSPTLEFGICNIHKPICRAVGRFVLVYIFDVSDVSSGAGNRGVCRVSVRVVLPAFVFWLSATAGALAQGMPNGSKGGAAAPEIDGPGGVAAIALLVCAGLIAYNRFKK